MITKGDRDLTRRRRGNITGRHRRYYLSSAYHARIEMIQRQTGNIDYLVMTPVHLSRVRNQ